MGLRTHQSPLSSIKRQILKVKAHFLEWAFTLLSGNRLPEQPKTL